MKTKLISIISILLIFIVGISGYFMYQKAEKEKTITKEIHNISKIENTFSETEDRTEKLSILKSTIEEMTDYDRSKKPFEKVSDKYASSISNMQKYFIKEYDSSLAENTLSNLDSSEDINTITTSKDNLTALLSTIEAEQEYTLALSDDFTNYKQKITSLTESYTNRITALEEAKKKAEEEAKQKAAEEAKKKAEEEKAKTHYENDYFSVDVPKEWIGYWSVTEEDNSLNGIHCMKYTFGYDEPRESYGGAETIYVLDMSDTSRPLSHYSRMLPSTCEEIGVTSFGNYDVFTDLGAGAGFFNDNGATITLK